MWRGKEEEAAPGGIPVACAGTDPQGPPRPEALSQVPQYLAFQAGQPSGMTHSWTTALESDVLDRLSPSPGF